MTKDRVTRYGANGRGGHNLGVTVHGISVLVTCDSPDFQAAADALAEAIAAIGPAVDSAPAIADSAPAPAAPAAPRPDRNFAVGDRVWCTVHGANGWCTVTAVGEGRNRGRIKIHGERAWCPVGNFDREPRR